MSARPQHHVTLESCRHPNHRRVNVQSYVRNYRATGIKQLQVRDCTQWRVLLDRIEFLRMTDVFFLPKPRILLRHGVQVDVSAAAVQVEHTKRKLDEPREVVGAVVPDAE